MMPFTKPPLNLKQQTQKALRIINQHERMKNQQIETMLNIQTQPNSSITNGPFKIVEPKQKIKVQLLPNTLLYYKMQLQSNIDPKIIIRQFRGGPVDIFFCFDKLVKDLDKSPYHFAVKDEMILKFAQKYVEEAKTLILVFKNSTNLTHFSFRIDTLRPKKPKSDANLDRSTSLLELDEININEVKLLRSKSSKVKLNKIINSDSHDLVFLKPEEKLKRISQRREQSLQKKQAAMKRIENIELNKQKSIQALKVVAVCKKMFSTYQDLVNEEETKKLALLKRNTPILYAIKYCFLSSMFFNERQRNMKRIITIKSYEKKFIRKIRRAYRETKALVPDRNVRQLQVFKQVGSFLGHSLNRVSMKRSIKITFQTFKSCLPGFLINLAMNQSNNYRRVIRTVQRRWKSKFQARNTMLLNYCQQQLKVILKAYPHLEYVAKQYRDSNKAYQIILDYQKQTASKMKDMIIVYKQKLAEISEYEQINKEIRKFNETCLKKKIKQLLQIPKKPAFPEFRFFRDVLFVKSMVRGELELMFRKFKKKNPQLFIEKQEATPPKKQHLKKSK